VIQELDELNISVYTFNALRRSGIDTVELLLTKSERDLLDLPHIGQVSLRDIRSALQEAGLPEPAIRHKRVCPHCGGLA